MIGRTILHYTIAEEVGRGGMGVVYKVPKFPATPTGSGEQVEFRGSRRFVSGPEWSDR